MFESVANQFASMSIGEEIYTICFTVFFVGGALCCCRRCELPLTPAREPTPEPKSVPRPQAEREETRRPAHIRSRPMQRIAYRRTVVAPRLRSAPLNGPRHHAAA